MNNLDQIEADIKAHEAEGRDMSVRRKLVEEVVWLRFEVEHLRTKLQRKDDRLAKRLWAALDERDALKVENERLTGLLFERETILPNGELGVMKEHDTLRAENDRLRDALRDILAYSANARMAPADKAQGMLRIALAALDAAGGGNDGRQACL